MNEEPSPREQLLARARARQALLWRRAHKDLGLFIELLSGPKLERPKHLAPLLAIADRAMHEPVRLLLSTPPRHGKTVTLEHAAVRYLKHYPDRIVGYLSHSQEFANRRSRSVRELGLRAGLLTRPIDENRWDPSASVRFWQTAEGGGFIAAGRDAGGVMGQGIHLLIVDDPYRNREEAESEVIRRNISEGFRGNLVPRLEPGGSIIVCHQRWHTDDLIGELARDGWPRINLPALDDWGNPLWPERFDRPALDALRREAREYNWYSQYMGEPRPREGKVFGPPHWYKPSELPTRGLTFAHGIDLAYSRKTAGDFSVVWSMARSGSEYYVLGVTRLQGKPLRQVAAELKRAIQTWPGPVRWYAGGTEIAAAELLAEFGVPVDAQPAKSDKLTRAQPFADAWNEGKIHLPLGKDGEAPPEWTRDVVNEVTDFTGMGDRHDDVIDGGAASYDELSGPIGIVDHAHRHGDSSRWSGFDGRGFG